MVDHDSGRLIWAAPGRSKAPLRKFFDDLTEQQKARLSLIAKTNAPLYRAYLLKEQLRQVFQLPPEQAVALLDSRIAWAQRSRLVPVQELARKIRSHRKGIENSLCYDLSNAIVESANTKIRLLTRVAFGFHSPMALIALAMLSLGGCYPALPHA